MHRIRIHREEREPDVVGLGDRSPERVPIHVTDDEVLEEPSKRPGMGAHAASPVCSARLTPGHDRIVITSLA
jgi:hypothetical protein